jgi:hypothetical protein
MVALRPHHDTVGDMTPRSAAAATLRSTCQYDPAEYGEVLASVAGALRASTDGEDWAVLEAWVLALTLVTGAALQAVPEEFHDFL